MPHSSVDDLLDEDDLKLPSEDDGFMDRLEATCSELQGVVCMGKELLNIK